MEQSVDYIIVGQGLAGSALAWELLERGKKIVVFDEPSGNRASRIAAGICNPMTGRANVKTYKAEELFPVLKSFYTDAGKSLHRKLFFPLPVYRPFLSRQECLQWKLKSESPDVREFILKVYEKPNFGDFVHDPFGGLEIAQSGYLDVGLWLSSVREVLVQKNAYHEERFCEDKLEISGSIRYQGYNAARIIFCNGLASRQSKWFDWLPLHPLKGETLRVEIALEPNRIYSRGVYLVPAGRDHQYVVGSTYNHPPFFEGPTEGALEHLQSGLRALVRLPFRILHQDWGIRPTVSDRRPLLGQHPSNNNVVIFNGLGTKGVSLAPYFAKCLADWLDQRGELPKEVNIFRFKSLYSK